MANPESANAQVSPVPESSSGSGAIAFHPPFIALHPPIALYATNVAIVPLEDILLPCAIILALSCFVWALLSFMLRDYRRAAIATTVLTLGVFFYEAISNVYFDKVIEGRTAGVAATLPLYIWCAIVLCMAGLLTRKGRATNPLNLFLNVAGVTMLGMALSSVLFSHTSINSELARRAKWKPTLTGTDAGDYSDIFYVVLDGYGSTETFERLYGFTDRPFLDELEEMGFYVASEARSNYCQTELSMSATLNMTPVQELATKGKDPAVTRAYLDGIIDDSAVSQFLRLRGYRYVAVTTGFPALRFDSADVRVSAESGQSLYINALLQKTPFTRGAGGYEPQFAARISQLEGGFEAIERLAQPVTSPRFVVVHILAPHPPFVFGPKGEHRRPEGIYGLWDGSHFNETIGSDEVYRNGYRDQAQYIALRTLAAIRTVVEKNPRAAIVIQGDHGPKMHTHQDLLEETDLSELFGILSAIRAPDLVSEALYPQVSPINTFRLLLSGIFGEDLPPLADRSYYSPWEAPLELTDVTDRLSGRSE